MAIRGQSNIVTFLPTIINQLVLNEVFTTDTCFLTMDDEPISDMPPGTPYCLVKPGSFSNWDGSTDGGGIESMIIRGNFYTTLWFMNALDEPPTDTSALTDTVLGVYNTVNKMITALEMFDPVVANAGILAEPMRLKDLSEPTRDDKHQEWVSIVMKWEASIWQNVGTGMGCINTIG